MAAAPAGIARAGRRFAGSTSFNVQGGLDMTSLSKYLYATVIALGLAAPASAADPIKIGVTMPLTGNVAFDGQNTVNGMQVAVKQINDAGGVLGRPLTLVTLDDKANPEEGVNAVKRLMSEENVHAIASALNSSVGMAQVDATNGRVLHVIVLASAPAITEKGYQNVFRVNTTSLSKEEPLIAYMKEKVSKPAMLLTNDDYGRGLLQMYRDGWADGGPEIASADFFQLTETNFLPYLTKIKFAEPDALYVAGQAVQLTTILKQAAQIGFQPEIVWTVGASINPTTLNLGGDALNGLISSENYIPALQNPANEQFTQVFRQEYPDQPVQFYHVVGYDSIQVIAKAMEAAGTADDWQQIAAAMREMTYESPRGTITFDETGQLRLETFLIHVVDGEPQVLDQ
jgi:branched-chain amino acid transport system substrate-binding protein